jgi:hypothetical protein
LNLSKSGLGISAGPRGLKLGVDARGRKYVNAGIPGTGLSTRQYLKPSSPASSSTLPARTVNVTPVPRSGNGPYLVVGAGVLSMVGLFFWATATSQPGAAPHQAATYSAPIALPDPKDAAITAARLALSRAHPTYAIARITDGTPAATRTETGYEVRLEYRTAAGAVLPYVCTVIGGSATCKSGTQVPSSPPAVSSGLHVGPRGGVYHYSASGRKVYQRRHK